MSQIKVACPECGDTQKLPVRTTSEVVGDSLVLTVIPDMHSMIEHFVVEHAAEAI